MTIILCSESQYITITTVKRKPTYTLNERDYDTTMGKSCSYSKFYG
jgi:hypothetical protein